MGRRLAAFADLPSHTISTILGGNSFRVRYTWRERMRAWYVDLFDNDGNALAVGRRMSPKSTPWSNFIADGFPTVFVICVGPDGYGQLDLGEILALVANTTAELEA